MFIEVLKIICLSSERAHKNKVFNRYWMLAVSNYSVYKLSYSAFSFISKTTASYQSHVTLRKEIQAFLIMSNNSLFYIPTVSANWVDLIALTGPGR